MNSKLILDKHRGIYFAKNVLSVTETVAGVKVDAEGIRHCLYYGIQEAGHKGTYGLATKGPTNDSKVGPPVNGTIYDVVKVIDVTDEAAKKWESIKW